MKRDPTTAPTPRTRQYRSGDERRSEIVEATIAIIAEQGLREVKTAELARRVGVSEATIFRHFGSLEEVLIAAVTREAAVLRDRISAFEGSGTPWERAEQLVLALIDFFEETGGGPIVIVTGQVVRISPAIRDVAMTTLGHVGIKSAGGNADFADRADHADRSCRRDGLSAETTKSCFLGRHRGSLPPRGAIRSIRLIRVPAFHS